jgi:hypothetical protein
MRVAAHDPFTVDSKSNQSRKALPLGGRRSGSTIVSADVTP